MHYLPRLRRDCPGEFLRAGTVALGALALALPLAAPVGAAESGEPAQQSGFVTRPDFAQLPPEMATEYLGRGGRYRVDDGYLLSTPFDVTAPPQAQPHADTLSETDPVVADPLFSGQPGTGGSAIYDNDGNLVWWNDVESFNLDVIEYQGEPALAVYEINPHWGDGQWVIRDRSYNEIARLEMQGGYTTMLHELMISPNGKRALLLSYQSVEMDLTEYGGPGNATVLTAVIQEQVIATGEVTFEWHALDHVPVTETQEPLTSPVVDYIHVSSMDYDRDGNLLISGRNTSTVYKVDRRTGDIMWRLGGEQSDFTFPDASDAFSYQHHVRRLPDGTLSMFDNGNMRDPQVSRGAVYQVDERRRTARLLEDLRVNDAFAFAMGSNVTTDNGNRLLSFGASQEASLAEFDGGRQVFEANFVPPTWFSYRTNRADWVGIPEAPPDVAWSEPDSDGSRDFHMSWNGATEVDRWRIEGGDSLRDLDRLETVEKTGFETAAEVDVPEDADVFRISALDHRGRVLDTRMITGATPTIDG